MKHVIRKPYWNFEKEEKWLNEMSAKGLALYDYSWCRYVFEDCEKGKYVYRIELLEHVASHPESQKQLEFFEEMGIEIVATYTRWVYLRKKADTGSFDLYSDIDSKIAHYKRVASLWIVLACLELGAGTLNISIGISRLPDISVNLFVGIPIFILGFVFLGVGVPVLRKLIRLKKQRRINES